MNKSPAVRPSRGLAALAAVVSGLLWFASLGVHHAWYLAWLMPLPLLVVLPAVSGRFAAFLAGLAAAIGMLNFVVAYPAMPLAIRLSTDLEVAAYFALVLGLWRVVARRSGPLLALLAYPLLLVAFDYLLSLLSPHGSAGNFAYSQADVLPLIQLASLTGPWGIDFLLALVPSALALAWRYRSSPRLRTASLLAALLPLALALSFGAWRLGQPARGAPLNVGLAASDDLVPHFAATSEEEALGVLSAYGAMVERLAGEGATWIVLPEKLVGVTPAYEGAVRAKLGTLARDRGLTLVAGINRLSPPPLGNQAWVFGPQGDTLLTYDKQHLLPAFESRYRTGSSLGLIDTPAGRLGVAICKDLDFPALGRAYARAGAVALLVPAWDFGPDGWLHSRMAVLRGVESGFAVVRAAAEGLLTVTDAKGRVMGEARTGDGPVTLASHVTVGTGPTLYARLGDWFAWLCLLGAAGTLLRVVLGRAAAASTLAPAAAFPPSPG